MEELKKKYDISDIGASGGSSGQIITLGANGKLGPANKPSYTASEVGAVATTGGTVTGAVSFTHGYEIVDPSPIKDFFCDDHQTVTITPNYGEEEGEYVLEYTFDGDTESITYIDEYGSDEGVILITINEDESIRGTRVYIPFGDTYTYTPEELDESVYIYRAKSANVQIDNGTISRASIADQTFHNLQILLFSSYRYTSGGSVTKYHNGSETTKLEFRAVPYTVTASSWSNSTDSNGYYTYTLSVSRLSGASKIDMKLVGTTKTSRPTADEITAYNLVSDYYYDDSLNEINNITLYAKTKPTTTFYVQVYGIYLA